MSEESSDSIAKELIAIKALLAEFATMAQPMEAEKNVAFISIKMYDDQIKKINEHKKKYLDAAHAIDERMYDLKRQMREAEKRAEQKERQLKQAMSAESLALEYKQLADKFDRLTAGAPWREWALDHQISGAKRLATAKSGILADKRGLGKTLTSLIWADMLEAKKLIIVVPKDVIRTYEREIKRWAPHRQIAPVGGIPKAQRDVAFGVLKKLDQWIVTINYEAWRKDKTMIADLIALGADTLICDEAHSIKNTKTAAFKGIEQIRFGANKCPKCGSINVGYVEATYSTGCFDCLANSRDFDSYAFCSIRNVLPMTGTPILNKPQDLYPLLRLTDPVNFYNENHFLQDYCHLGFDGKWNFNYGGLDRLVRKLSHMYVARDRKTAGVIIPPQEILFHDLEFDADKYPEQAKVLRQLNDFAQLVVAPGKAVNILFTIALITRKRQAILWPAGINLTYTDPDTDERIEARLDNANESVKLDFVLNETNGLLRELDEAGERTVVFSQFKQPLIELERRCKEAGISVVRFDGDTDYDTAEEVKIDFDAAYCRTNGREVKWQVVLANFKKGGVGLNFTDATQMIILDEEWNPGKNEQAYGRIDRMGQTRETTVHVLRVQNSIDDWMSALNDSKQDLISGFENETDLAQDLLEKLRNGEML